MVSYGKELINGNYINVVYMIIMMSIVVPNVKEEGVGGKHVKIICII